MLLSIQKSEPVSGKSAELLDLVFLHGTGSAGDMWKNQVAFFTARGYRCYVIDLRGHGLTKDPCEHTDLAVHLSDVVETLEASDIQFPAAFVGHSLGAMISVTLAQSRPEMFKTVLAAALPGRVLKPVTYAFKLFMEHSYDHVKKKNMHQNWNWRNRTLIETNKHALEQIVLNFGDLDFVTNAPQMACTLHLAAGRFDPVAPCHYATQIHKKVPGSTLKVFELGGHNFMDTFKESFNQWILSGLK